MVLYLWGALGVNVQFNQSLFLPAPTRRYALSVPSAACTISTPCAIVDLLLRVTIHTTLFTNIIVLVMTPGFDDEYVALSAVLIINCVRTFSRTRFAMVLNDRFFRKFCEDDKPKVQFIHLCCRCSKDC